MGFFNHQAIIVICSNGELAKEVHKKAVEMYPYTTELLVTKVNAYYSFMLGPDGSKEGWKDSNEGEKLREEFVEYLKHMNIVLNKWGLQWCAINFPEDDKPYITMPHYE